MAWKNPNKAPIGSEVLVTVLLFDGTTDVKLGQRFKAGWWCSGCNPGAQVIAYDDKPTPYKPKK